MDLVEESMRMIGGLQSLARTQSSQYVINDSNWVCHVCLIVTLKLDFADFSGTSNGNYKLYQESFRGKDQEPRT